MAFNSAALRLSLRRWVAPRIGGRPALVAPLLAITLLLVAVPLGVLAIATIKPSTALPWDAVAFTTANFVAVFANPITYGLLGNTFLYAGGSLVLGLAVAFGLAWLVERTDLPGRRIVVVALVTCLGLPPMLTALGWTLWLSPRVGLANTTLRSMLGSSASDGPLNGYSLGGMMFVTALAVCPSAFMMISPVVRAMDPAFEEAAQVSGANWRVLLRRVTLPLLLPGLLAVVLYYMVALIQFFDIPLALGLPGRTFVLSTRIFLLTQPENGSPEYGLAATYALIALVFGIVLMSFYIRATRQVRRFQVVSGKAYRPRRRSLGRWRYPCAGLVLAYFIVALGAPLLVLLWVSLLPFYQPPSVEALSAVSLKAYARVLADPRVVAASVNTLLLMIAAATLSMLLAVLIAWLSIRVKVRGARALESLAFLALAIPSVVTALAVLLFYIRTPLYGTIAIILVGQLTAYLPFGTRTMSSAVIQLNTELEESATVHGAGTGSILRRVLAPLLAPAIANGWIWVAVHSIRDFTFPLMLGTTGNVVLAAMIWKLWRQPDLPASAALSVVLALVLGGLAGLSRSLLAARSEEAL